MQDNLRPRVASVTYQDRAVGAYERGTHYSYDIHGNVESLVQHVREGVRDLRKRIDYDLVSSNVNRVYYQKGEADQFIHRYAYDGDNRITEVHTSRDGVVWTKEANYEYYAHGPLARTVLGDQRIETQDFAYTLQGWMKALNGQYFSYALGYFSGDYSSIGTTGNLATPVAANKDLYNGNITTMASLNPKLSETVWTQQFGYDQLNRITGSQSMIGLIHADAFRTSYSYDANGNILSLHRYNKLGQVFDALAYHYHNQQNGYKHNTNKLRWVDDEPLLSGIHAEDLEDQDMDNYHYDELGNLSRDVQEEIARIEWNVYGKISKVIRTAESNDSNLEFLYDASGNRVVKVQAGQTVSELAEKYNTTIENIVEINGLEDKSKIKEGQELIIDQIHIKATLTSQGAGKYNTTVITENYQEVKDSKENLGKIKEYIQNLEKSE